MNINALIKAIQKEIIHGQEQVKLAVQKQKVVTYWKIGSYIHKHLGNKEDNNAYGEYLFPKLSEATGIGLRTLYRIVQFYETFPKLKLKQVQLTWSHYKLLLIITDPDLRNNLENLAIKNNMTIKELENLMLNKNLLLTYKHNPDSSLLIKNGLPYIYRLKYLNSSKILYIDFGFNIYKKLSEKQSQNFSENDLIYIKNQNNHYSVKKVTENSGIQLYNYKAYIEEIIDGDTLKLIIDLDYGISTRQKIRLRGINSEEIITETGKKAKQYIANRLLSCPYIFIKTYWRDKFNRYLADVFYNKAVQDVNELVMDGAFLNQELLDKGLAKRY